MADRRKVGTTLRRSVVAVAIALVIAGCGSDDDLTVDEQLQKLAGHPLTPAEVTEQLALADTMCNFDARVLDQIWIRLDARQLEFQDFVFGQHCPDRLSIYEEIRPNTGTVPDDLATSTSDEDADEPTTNDGNRTGSKSDAERAREVGDLFDLIEADPDADRPTTTTTSTSTSTSARATPATSR